MKKLLSSALLLGVALVALGRGPKTPDGMPPLQPVALTITQEGPPVADAMITLKSLDGANNFTSGGTTGANGVANLVTHGQYKGVPEGKYKVAVSKIVGEGTPPPPSPIDEESARKWKEYQDSGATYEEFNVIDMKYSTIETTDLEIEVVKGKNDLSLEVGAAIREKVNVGSGVL